jgi:hypothetical protein
MIVSNTNKLHEIVERHWHARDGLGSGTGLALVARSIERSPGEPL